LVITSPSDEASGKHYASVSIKLSLKSQVQKKMAKSFALKLIWLVGLVNAINGDSSTRVVCYYDTRSSLKDGEKINRPSAPPFLPFCPEILVVPLNAIETPKLLSSAPSFPASRRFTPYQLDLLAQL
jgi:hypothetical protein